MRRDLAVFVIFGFSLLNVANSFSSPLLHRVSSRIERQRRISWILSATDELEAEKRQLETALEDIITLKTDIKGEKDAEKLLVYQSELNQFEEQVSDLSSTLIPPKGMSMDEYMRAINLFIRLPYESRLGLAEALELKDSKLVAGDFDRVPYVVSLLFEKQDKLTSERIRKGLDEANIILNRSPSGTLQLPVQEKSDSSLGDLGSQIENDEEIQPDATVDQMLPRVTRKEGRVATKKDLDVLTRALGNKIFSLSAVTPISGGYVLRGENLLTNSTALLNSIDTKVPQNWDCQVSFVPDFTPEGLEIDGLNPSPVLVLLKKNMSTTTSPFLLGTTSCVALVTTFLFCFGVYGSNDLVTSRLGAEDMSGIDWFNGKVVELLVPLALIQFSRGLAEFTVAKKDAIQTELPVMFPFWGIPFLGPQTRIKESPKDLTVLFDFAIIGPVVGMIASLVFLGAGLQATGTAPNDVALFFPSLPVSSIRMSTAGSAIIDEFFGGAGSISLQDPAMPIPLHPWAIAGYVALIVNALELVPIGATSGGRLALSLFGRPGTAFVGGTIWLLLLVTILFGADVDVILGSWVIYNIAQNDLEVPARDEVQEVSTVRAVFAFLTWFAMVLVLTPL